MAVTIAVLGETSRGRNVTGRDRVVYVDITGPATYTTGGELLTLAQLKAVCPGLGTTLANWSKVKHFDSETNPAGYRCALDRDNTKLLFFDPDSEATSSGNLSAVVVRVAITYDA